MDLIGAPAFSKEFVVSGTCTQNLHGMCEALYKPDMVNSFCWCYHAENVYQQSSIDYWLGTRRVVRSFISISSLCCG